MKNIAINQTYISSNLNSSNVLYRVYFCNFAFYYEWIMHISIKNVRKYQTQDKPRTKLNPGHVTEIKDSPGTSRTDGHLTFMIEFMTYNFIVFMCTIVWILQDNKY